MKHFLKVGVFLFSIVIGMRINAMNVYGTITQSFLYNNDQVPSHIYYDDIGNMQTTAFVLSCAMVAGVFLTQCLQDLKIKSFVRRRILMNEFNKECEDMRYSIKAISSRTRGAKRSS